MPTSTQKLSRAGCRMFSIFPPSRPAYGRILALDPPLPVSSAPRIVLRHASLYLVVFSVLSMLADMAVFLLGLSVAAVASRRVASARARVRLPSPARPTAAFSCCLPALIGLPPRLAARVARPTPSEGTERYCRSLRPFSLRGEKPAFPNREGEPKEKRRGGPR